MWRKNPKVPSLPLTLEEEKRALLTIGVQSVDDLFSTVPPKIRENADFQLDFGSGWDGKSGLSEHELRLYFQSFASKNAHFPQFTHFLGGGIYDNVVPAIVNQLVLRGEFLTCYTPYQPEISQGTLQTIFEFQTMICRLTSMEVANASMYDGATATAEAVLMAHRLKGKGHERVLIAGSLPPDYRSVVTTFLQAHAEKPVEIGWSEDGTLRLEELAKRIEEQKPDALVVASPNYFGVIEPIEQIRSLLSKETLLIVSVADISSLSLFEPPGALGADIVVGEAHQLGTPMLFGGPHVGFFATKKEYLRQMPGRLAGETVDSTGQRAYTLTLSTREQHIRREKATSNICTNQGLIALRTCIYLSFLGKQGFQRLGEINFSLFEYLTQGLESFGIRKHFKNSLCYREGVFEIPNLERRFEKALAKNIIPGIPLDKKFSNETTDFSQSLLICVHPKLQKSDLDKLIEVLSHD